MERITPNFELKTKVDTSGNVTVKSDNIAVGLLICLMGLFCVGLFTAMIIGSPDPAQWYDFHREPISVDTRETNEIIEKINRDLLEQDPNAEPFQTLPVVVKSDPGGFDWEAFWPVIVIHAFGIGGLVAAVIGPRLMLTGTTISFNKRQALVKWEHTSIRRTSSKEYDLSQVELILYKTEISSYQAPDWHGFAASLVNKDNASIQIARSKKMEAVKQYANEFRSLTGIEVRRLGIEQDDTTP